MKKCIILVSLVGAILASAPVRAESDGRISLGITGGTLGIGPEVSYRASEKVAVRANLTFFTISRDFDSDDVTYSGKVKLKSGGLMLDFHPGGGGFRLSAGARINGNRAEVVATPSTPVTINGRTYTPAQIGTLRGRADTKSLAPVLTIGYGGRAKSGIAFGVEAGAMFQGSVRVQPFTASGTGVAAADLASEQRSLQDDVDGFKVYPVLQLSLGYRF